MKDTEHFKADSKVDRIRCPCCGMENMQQELIDNLEILRKLTGKPVIVTSCWRCSKHNAEIGGAKASPHMGGYAADIVCPELDIFKFFVIVECSGLFQRIGLDLFKNFIHVDMEPEINPYWARRWWYDSDGGQVVVRTVEGSNG